MDNLNLNEFMSLEEANIFLNKYKKGIFQHQRKLNYIKNYNTINKEQVYERNRQRYKTLDDEKKEAYKAKKRLYYHEKGKLKREEKKKLKREENKKLEMESLETIKIN